MAGPGIGYATLSIIPSARGFKSNLAGAVGGPVDQVGKDSGGRFGKAFAAASKVALAGSAAAIGFGIKGLMDFTGFERQMNEVFTLLPDLSGEAMSDMTGQVKDFAKEFGVLPDEVIPALYQSISAGVPQENVFSFLETAQMAAKGGVTELTTAVDGISSVVNAYGSEVLNATEASDLMFTAVKLGKTDFEQLSGSLFNVIPTAAGLGVQFEDITAALAAMTAQGVPTSVATTQLRQLFVELSKEGGATADVFEEMAGKSFKEFIAEGGNTADALGLMLKGADKLDVGVNDLFGSVEAGSAALSLAGSETFVNNIDAMGDSAGATKTAFEQMETGLGPIMDKVKAHLSVASISVGEWLAPFIEAGLASLSEWWGANGANVLGFLDTIGSFLRDSIAPALGDAAGAIVRLVQEGFVGLSAWWAENGDTVLGRLQTLGDLITDPVLVAFGWLAEAIRDEVLPRLGDFVTWILDNESVLLAFGTMVGVTLVGYMLAYATSALAAAGATLLATWPMLLAIGVLGAMAGATWWALQNLDWFKEAIVRFNITFGVWMDFIRDAIDLLKDMYRWIQDVVEAMGGLSFTDQSGITTSVGGFFGPAFTGIFGSPFPSFASGGVMPGPRGEHNLAWVAGGETILPTHDQDFSVGNRGSDLDGLVVVLDSGTVAGRIRQVDSVYRRRNAK